MKQVYIVVLCVITAAAVPQFFNDITSRFGDAARKVSGFGAQFTQVAQQTVDSALPVIAKHLPKQFQELVIQPNLDCGCPAYEAKAKQCNWPEQKCNLLSFSFINFIFWCNSLNRFRDAKRLGLIKNSYEQTLSCLANLSLLQRQLTQLGLKEPDNIEPKPITDNALPATGVAVPSSIDWSSEMSSVRNQGECASCYAFASLALCEWSLKKNGENVTLSVS